MSVDLNQCVPGQKVRLRDGRLAVYMHCSPNLAYPHYLQILDKGSPPQFFATCTDDGRFMSSIESARDVIGILPLDPEPAPAKPATTPQLKSPAHYGNTWAVGDFIREQGLSFHLGNAVKYICRCEYKGAKAEDLRKAIHYLQNELDHMEAGE